MKKNCFKKLNLNKALSLSFFALATTFYVEEGALAAFSTDETNKIYTITQTDENDYSFINKTTNDDGTITTDYYKINLNPEKFSNSKDITWQKVNSAGDRTIEVKLPNNKVEYYQYSYKDNNFPVKDETNNVYINNIRSCSGNFCWGNKQYYGGAINNQANRDSIIGDFIGNSSQATDMYTAGGAIFNNAEIKNITGNFISNYAQYYGGAIINQGTIDSIAANFISNYANGYTSAANKAGAIYNDAGGTINSLTGDFISNTAREAAGVIFNYGTLTSITSGDINVYFTTINSIKNSNFISNTAGKAGGVMVNSGIINSIADSNFILNSAGERGGAIVNYGTIGSISADFVGNSVIAASDGIIPQGGAIYSETDLNFNLDNKQILIKDNFTQTFDGTKDDNAIYMNSNWGYVKLPDGTTVSFDSAANLNFNLTNNSSVALYDNIRGADGVEPVKLTIDNQTFYSKDGYYWYSTEDNTMWRYLDTYEGSKGRRYFLYLISDDPNESRKIYLENDNYKLTKEENPTPYTINLTGDPTSTFNLYNTMYNAKLNLGSINLNTINNEVYTNPQNPVGLHDSYHFKNITLTNNTNFLADVDLANKQMDRLTAESYGNHKDNQLNIKGLNLISDAKENKTAIYFAQPGLKNNVTLDSSNQKLPNKQHQTTLYTPIYAYDVTYDNQNEYDNKGDGGYLLFQRGGSGNSNSSNQFNPAILSSPVSTTAAAQTTLNETFKYAFEHLDTFTKLPNHQRLSQINKNKYALLDNPKNKSQIYSTEFNNNLPINLEYNKAGWMRPYTVFESIPLKHGPKIDSISYGSIFGYDGEFKHHKNGWNSILSTYLGYNGSSINYKNVDSITNGGLIGLTQTYYKNNFWTALTLTTGANNTRNQTMYGPEDFTTFLAGIANKTGYNLEFKEGKYIIQPMIFTSYTFINPFDYTNAANVKITSNPTHNLQINPNIRFIINLKNGLQPYLSAGVIFNPLHESKTTANGILLPEMYIKPYAEYGVGLQYNKQDKFNAFFQTMLRNGGRSGIALTAGFRWSIGRCEHGKNSKEEL